MNKKVIELTQVELKNWGDIGYQIIRQEEVYRNMSASLAIREVVRRISKKMEEDPAKYSAERVAYDLLEYTK